MSFAKPKLISKSAAKVPPATTTVEARPLATPNSKPTTKSFTSASRNFTGTASVRKTARTASSGLLTPFHPSSSSKSSSHQEDSLSAELEEAFGLYLASEFIRLTAEENLHDAKRRMDKECTHMWTALSQQRDELTKLEIEFQELKFLQDFSEKCRKENELLKDLKRVLPETAEKVGKLSDALIMSDNFIQIKGVKVEPHQMDQVAEMLNDKNEKFQELSQKLKSDEVGEVTGLVSEMTSALNDILNCFRQSEALVKELRGKTVLRESLEMTNKGLEEDDILLVIPDPVQVPKLIDF